MSVAEVLRRAGYCPQSPQTSPSAGDAETPVCRAVPNVPKVPAQKQKSEQERAHLLALTEAEGLPAALVYELTAADLHDCQGEPEQVLVTYLHALDATADRKAGCVPKGYNARAWCRHCGLIWLWTPGIFDGCVWCFNRVEGLAIPRPPVSCGECRHFERIQHPHLGHCAAGQLENPAGLWDTDTRCCGQHEPLDVTP